MGQGAFEQMSFQSATEDVWLLSWCQWGARSIIVEPGQQTFMTRLLMNHRPEQFFTTCQPRCCLTIMINKAYKSFIINVKCGIGFPSVFFIDNVVCVSVLCYRLQLLFCVLLLWFYKRVITLACLFIFSSLIHVLPSPNVVTNRSWRDLQWPCVWLIIYYILIAYSTTYSDNTYSCLLSEVYKMSASVYYKKRVCVCLCHNLASSLN